MQRLVGLKFFAPVDERATLYDTTEEVEGERILFAKEADNFYEEPLQQVLPTASVRLLMTTYEALLYMHRLN